MKRKMRFLYIFAIVSIISAMLGIYAVADNSDSQSEGQSGIASISTSSENEVSSIEVSSNEVSSQNQEELKEDVPNDGTYLIYLGNDQFNPEQIQVDEKGDIPFYSTPEEWALSDVAVVVKDTQEILTPYIQVIDLDGFDAATPGEYTLRFAVIKDGITLVTFSKSITVRFPFAPRVAGTLPMNLPPGAVVPSDAVSGTINAGSSTRVNDYLMFTLENTGKMRLYARDTLPSLVNSPTDDLLKWYREYFGATNVNVLYGGQNHLLENMSVESFTYDYTNPSDPDNSPIVATTVHVNSDIRLYLTYEIEPYSRTLSRSYRVESRADVASPKPVTIQDVRFYVDTAFHGSDSGRGGYDGVNDIFYLWNNATSGMLTQTTDPTTPFTSGQLSVYTKASSKFQSTVSPMPTDGGTGVLKYCNTTGSYDTGWAFSWTVNQTLQPGEDLNRNSYETVIPPGGLSVVSPSPKTAPQGAMVDYQYTIYNLSDSAQTATLIGSTPNGWATFLDQQTVVIPAGGSAVVTANVLVPSDATDGDIERFDLTASYTNSSGAVLSGTGSVNTTVDSNMKAITNVQLTYKSDTRLDVKVQFNDKVPANTPTTIKLMYSEGANAGQILPDALFTPVTQNISSGDIMGNMNTTNVPNGKYYIYVTAEGVPYPHRTTVYIKDGTIEIPITEFSVTPPSAVIGKGNTASPFTTSYLPADATHTGVTWNSLDTSIATVNASTGAVTGVEIGTVTLEVWPTNYPLLKKTVTVEVKPVVSAVSATPKVIEMRKDETATVTATVTPTDAVDKSLSWSSSATSVATVAAATDNTATATVTGGSTDGVSTVTVASVDQPSKTDTVTVKVDNTAPVKNSWSLTDGITAASPTNKPQVFTANVTDNAVNGYASGMTGGKAGVYTQMVATGSTAPTFDPSSPTGWNAMAGDVSNNYTYTYSTLTEGEFDVYLAMSDKLGNISVIKYTSVLDVDKTAPVFDVAPIPALHVFQGTTGYTITTEGKTGVTATDAHDGAVPAASIVVSNSGSFNVNTPGKYTIQLTATDQAGNAATANRDVYVHGIPSFSLGASVSINADEGSIILGGSTADGRLGYTAPAAVPNYKTDLSSQNSTPDVTYSFVGASNPNVTITGNTLDFSGLYGATSSTTVTVRYTASYTNEVLGASSVTKDIVITFTPNGTTPGSPVVNPANPGIVGSDGSINFYKNHGAIKYTSGAVSNPGVWVSTLSVADIEGALTGAPDTSVGDTSVTRVSVSILVDGTYQPINASNLSTALGTIGSYKIRYEFKGVPSGAVRYNFVTLNVHGDVDFTSTPINAAKSTSNLNPADSTYGSAPTASYVKADGTTQTLTVTAPSGVSLGTVGTSEINYTVNYVNNTTVTQKRVLRVHDLPAIGANDQYIRVGDAIPTVTSTVQLAPVTVGGTTPVATPVTVTNSTVNTSTANAGNITYTASYPIDTTVYTGNALTLTNTATKVLNVSENPEIQANDISISKDLLTAPNWLTYPAIGLSSSVQYATGTPESLTSSVEILSNDVSLGTIGTYQIVYEVSDGSAAGKPSQLAAKTVTKQITVTISEFVRNPPVINGTKDYQIVTGDSLNLLNGITVTDVEDGTIPNSAITMTVVQETGIGYSGNIADIPNNVGRYKVTYTVQDSVGNTVKVDKYVRVYSPITITSTAGHIVDVRKDAAKGVVAPDQTTVTAEYMDADSATMVSFTGGSNPAVFQTTNTVDYGTLGAYTIQTTVQHPVFTTRTDLEANTNFTVRVHGPIEITGTDTIQNVSPRRIGDVVDVTTGVVAKYTNYTGTDVYLTNTDLRVAIAGGGESGVTATPITTTFSSPGLYPIVYSVEDLLVPSYGKTIVSISVPIHGYPQIQVGNPVVVLEQNMTQADAETALGVTASIIYGESAPTPTALTPIYDFSAVDLTQPGVYYGTVYAEDRFGVKTAVENFEVQIYGSVVITPVIPPGGGGTTSSGSTSSGGSATSGGTTSSNDTGSNGSGSGGSGSSSNESTAYVPPQPPFLNVTGNSLNVIAYRNEVTQGQVEGMVAFNASYVGPDKKTYTLPTEYHWNPSVLTDGGTETITISATNPYTGKAIVSPNTINTYILNRPYIQVNPRTLYIFEGDSISSDGREFGPRIVAEQPNFETGQIEQVSFAYEFNKEAVDTQTAGIYSAFFVANFTDFAGMNFYFREQVVVIVQKRAENKAEEASAEASNYWVKSTDILHLAKAGEVWLVTPENYMDGGEKLDETIPADAGYDRKIIVKAGSFLTMNPCFIERLADDQNSLAEVQLEGRSWIFHSKDFENKEIDFRGSFPLNMDIVHKDYLDQKAGEAANMQISFGMNRSWMGSPTFQVKLNDALLEQAGKGSSIYMYWNNAQTGELELIGKMSNAGNGYYSIPMKSVYGEYLIMAGVPTSSSTNMGSSTVNFRITNETNTLTESEAEELGVALTPYGTSVREISRNPEAIASIDSEEIQGNQPLPFILAVGGIVILGAGGFIFYKKKKSKEEE